ncbi:PP2C family protein-serine/threonine phosphatase [Anaeromassilibacillus sp. 1001302B_160321_C8]|uniref:PP2C family protein-serine/threonine phosphatase n=1 Tax=Anaeromassilibacillus sp. 1001302B_160321_C8 TaxID=2787132 RepID=UPI00189A4CD3|nr:protein phosphatase 2C domain-containing protein [Anaeromassilibacillus sp. 1001302B_160321_C8]
MLEYAIMSEIGSRNLNEDYVGAVEKNNSYCFVVCDGLGGHGMGDVASHFVTDVFIEQFNICDSYDGFLSSAFSQAQERLIEHQKKNKVKNKMRTTAAAMLVDDVLVYIGHVGDSRVYVFDGNGIKKRTVDHSVPQMLALSGEITEEEIRKHPDRNIILRAMGTDWESPMFELLPSIYLAECRAFLLCSDGFWEFINENEMFNSLNNSKTADEWLRTMKSVVEKNGINKKMDNYSAIAVLISKGSEVQQ